MKFITENSGKWSQIISEELGVKDQNKLDWMSRYAQIHEIHEGLQTVQNADAGIYATPFNTMGIGNPMMPQGVGYTQGAGIGNTGADFHNPNYKVGSGDIPMSTLTMALEVAAMTIGFELVPVIPMNGPWAMLSYFDTPYAGGKMGRLNETAFDGKGEGANNKPIYIKINHGKVEDKSKFAAGAKVTLDKFEGEFIGFSRIDNGLIVKVVSCGDAKTSIAEAMEAAAGKEISVGDVKIPAVASYRAELISTAADHVQGFSNFFDGGDEPMSRAQNETGVGNMIGARMFTKMVQAGSYEVTGQVTRQQLQDMPLYGIDVVGKVLEAMQNELSQAINNRILDRLHKMGVTNAADQKEIQGLDLNLYFGPTTNSSKELKQFGAAKKFVDIHGVNRAENWGPIMNATQNTAAENVTTHQRRIMSRVLAAANVITQVSRWGRPNWVVTNAQVLSALQDCSSFVIAPMVNTLTQDGSQSLYFAGSIAGLNLYVDPYMDWSDLRVLVGSKGDGNTPGVIFAPYILADSIQIVAEGTMAPKMLMNSRFSIIDFGFHPEQRYFEFLIDANGAYLI